MVPPHWKALILEKKTEEIKLEQEEIQRQSVGQ